jgi:DNA gyrase/topoisomerase IV subunit B
VCPRSGSLYEKYYYIQHPQRGRVIFNLYPFQGKVLNLWKENPYSIVLKSRQLGISTLAAGYSLMDDDCSTKTKTYFV